MTVDWSALAIVAVVSFAGAVLVVVLVSFALVGLSAREPSPVTGRAQRAGLSPAAGTATAVLCLLGAATIVLYGLYLIVR